MPTRDRASVLERTFVSLAALEEQPTEAVVVDASDGQATAELCRRPPRGLRTHLNYLRAEEPGAAAQRNQGVAAATQPAILFHDDDILFEPDCVIRLWEAVSADPTLGGVNAMITNESYRRPGRASRWLFRFLRGHAEDSYGGLCLGPGLNLLPDDSADLPPVVSVEWLSTGCTLYWRRVLPDPPFDSFFQGYSLGEDLALSLTVRRDWALANVRSARILHDCQPGDHKADRVALERMTILNRYFIMRRLLSRHGFGDHLKFAVWQAFDVAGQIRHEPRVAPRVLWGAAIAAARIATGSALEPRDNGVRR